MKALSAREYQILHFLLERRDFVPVKEIASHMNWSEKTIYRELNALEHNLDTRGIRLERKPGTGIALALTQEQTMELRRTQWIPGKKVVTTLSVEARRIKILTNLLYDSPEETSINKLSEEYFIGKASIVNDLKAIEERIEPFHLRLEKSQLGTRLIGSEIDIRKAMASLIHELVSEERKEEQEHQSRIDGNTLGELIEHFGSDPVKGIQRILEETEQRLGYTIGDPYYINMLTHLLICIRRLKSGKVIRLADGFSEHPVTDPAVHSIAKDMANRIREQYGLELPSEEIYFIYQYLISSGMSVPSLNHELSGLMDKACPESKAMVKELIQTVSGMIRRDLTKDEQLYKGLIIHFKPMLNRLKYNISIKNPLLEEISKEYAEIFSLVRLGMLPIAQACGLNTFSDDEISYLVLYFQASIEKSSKKKRVILVCSTGIGTSHLLKNRINRSFPEWEVVDVISVSWFKRTEDWTGIDLIISTVKLEHQDLPVVYVSALLNDTDVSLIKAKFNEEKLNQHQNKVFSFPLLGAYVHPSCLQIETNTKATFTEGTASRLKLLTSILKHVGANMENRTFAEAKLNNHLSVFLTRSDMNINPVVGFNVVRGEAATSKLEIVIAFSKGEPITELLIEIQSLLMCRRMYEQIMRVTTPMELVGILQSKHDQEEDHDGYNQDYQRTVD
ncbi:BglG family transcription antiterminator [Paenibacillus pabuli]|uniref:BglG family transcription antiterminator n=1 Tax=Paenibacillus pabuli TaxID=1472 RepID=UPI000782A476|nr:transcription antiterminator [Paenibacillus pabuli]MEC0126401.1 transcription antiterminator [Paenibacillus pabuli]